MAPDSDQGPCVAYMMSRFPKLTETFVLDEVLELGRRGVRVEVFPLWREHEEVVHADARAVVDGAHFTPTLDGTILVDNLRCLAASPGRYLGTLATLVRANLRSPRFLAAALAIFPKACHLGRRMRALGVRHVHAHFASHPAAAAFVIGRLAGLPWSFTAHGSDLHREQAMLPEKVAEAAFVVAISEYNRRFILDRVGGAASERIRVIHCGVDLDRFGAPTDRSRGREADEGEPPFEVICIGTLHAVKGQRFLVEAAAILAERGVDVRCHLVGEGPDRAALESLARQRGATGQVRFHGALDREQVRRLLGSVDAAAAPSVPTADGRREGIPVALMEAAASGLPLVASRLSGIPELVREGETGLLVEPGDAAGLARALERLARDPATRAGLGKTARRLVEEEFALAGNVERLFREMGLGALR